MASPGKRQMIRATQVRSPDISNDQISEDTIRALADAAVQGGSDTQTFLSLIISQLRLDKGSSAWTYPPSPQPGSPSYIPEYHAPLIGDQNGHNLVFMTQFYFVPITLCLFYNGQAWRQGAAYDFVVGESGGSNTGFNMITINHTNRAPVAVDDLWVNYTRA